MRTKMSVKMAELQVDILVDRGLMTSNLLPTWTPPTAGNFFTLPDEVFYLNLSHGAITVYAYLLCCEDRRSHQCHPSYTTTFWNRDASIPGRIVGLGWLRQPSGESTPRSITP